MSEPRPSAESNETPARTTYFAVLDAASGTDRRLATIETITAMTPIPDADSIVTARI